MKKRTAIGEHAIGQASARKSRVRADVANYDGMDFGRDELYGIMRTTYDELINFVTTPAFKAFHKELMGLLPKKRPSFVAKVLFDPDERIKNRDSCSERNSHSNIGVWRPSPYSVCREETSAT